MAVFGATDTLRRAAADAAAEVAVTYGMAGDEGGRKTAVFFESALVDRLVEPATVAAILSEMQAAQPGCVDGLTIRAKRSESELADFTVELTVDGPTFDVPVNVKRLSGAGTAAPEATAVPSLLYYLTEDSPGRRVPRGWEVQGRIVEMAAGRRRIKPGRDYYMLLCRTDRTGVLTSVQIVGALGEIGDDGRPMLDRHPSRETTRLRIRQQPQLIPHSYEINAELALALLPRVTDGDLRATLLKRLCDRDPTLDRRELAARLIDADIDTLLDALGAAVLYAVGDIPKAA